MVPRDGEPGVETWKDNSWQYSGHANLWSLISVDEELGYAYLPLTSPKRDMYGGHRLGVALRAGFREPLTGDVEVARGA